jgi:hypothetical protein
MANRCYDTHGRYFAGEVLRVLREVTDVHNLYVNYRGHVLDSSANITVPLTEDGDIGLLVEGIHLNFGVFTTLTPILQTSSQVHLTSIQRQRWMSKSLRREAERQPSLRMTRKTIVAHSAHQVLIVHSARGASMGNSIATVLDNFGEVYVSICPIGRD